MKIVYQGPYPRVSVPGRPNVYVERGAEVDVPDTMVLPTTWRKVAEKKSSAKPAAKE